MAFKDKVLEQCSKVPKGKITTYKQIANSLGCGAYRAVGMALGRNQHAPVIPCHRVIASDGSLGGYTHPLGLSRKIELLKKEGIPIEGNKVVNFSHYLHQF